MILLSCRRSDKQRRLRAIRSLLADAMPDQAMPDSIMPTHASSVLAALPDSMLTALSLLPDPSQPLTLLTRHSVRERADGQGFASYDLPLTPMGRQLALEWGFHLSRQSGRQIAHCISSPIQRCVDTASLMLQGQKHTDQISIPIEFLDLEQDVQHTGLLVEPGSFVVDVEQAGPLFRQHGPLKFINHFLDEALPGMKAPREGVHDILRMLHQHQQSEHNQLLLAVSHDTILAALLAVMAGHRNITWDDWPEMMEGVFLWFEGEQFANSQIHWVWRGQRHSKHIDALWVHKDMMDDQIP